MQLLKEMGQPFDHYMKILAELQQDNNQGEGQHKDEEEEDEQSYNNGNNYNN